jgi:hypothetical protein
MVSVMRGSRCLMTAQPISFFFSGVGPAVLFSSFPFLSFFRFSFFSQKNKKPFFLSLLIRINKLFLKTNEN